MGEFAYRVALCIAVSLTAAAIMNAIERRNNTDRRWR